MAKIIAQRRDCTGKGWETFVEGQTAPIFNYGAKPLDDKALDAVVAARAVAKAEAEKRAAVDAAIQAEVEKRKAAVVDLYSKSGTDAMTSIFAKAAEVPK